MRAVVIVIAAAALGLLAALWWATSPGPRAAGSSGPAQQASAPPGAGPGAPGSEPAAPDPVAPAARPSPPTAPTAQDPEARAASELVERYRRAAEAARERVAAIDRARPAAPVQRNPLLRPFERPGPDTPRRAVWDRHVAPLLYPPGHPRAGEPLDNTTPEALADAADAMLRAALAPDLLEKPRRPLRLQQSFRTVQELQREHGVGRAFADAVESMPPDPEAPVYDPYWVPTDADDPGATTYAEYYRERNLEQARQLIEASRGAQ